MSTDSSLMQPNRQSKSGSQGSWNFWKSSARAGLNRLNPTTDRKLFPEGAISLQTTRNTWPCVHCGLNHLYRALNNLQLNAHASRTDAATKQKTRSIDHIESISTPRKSNAMSPVLPLKRYKIIARSCRCCEVIIDGHFVTSRTVKINLG